MDDVKLNFCEAGSTDTSVVWLSPVELTSPSITPLDDMREFYAAHILPNLCCRFSISLQDKYYTMLKSGTKDIELRLYDEKRRMFQIGDIILIYNAQKPTDYMRCKIVHLHIAPSFADLAIKISVQRTGFATTDEMLRAISPFYPAAQEAKYGVVGIELEPAD